MTHTPDCVVSRGQHCGACHLTFGSMELFDLHRIGHVDARRCVQPLAAYDSDGKTHWVMNVPEWGEAKPRVVPVVPDTDYVWRTPEGHAAVQETVERLSKARSAAATVRRSAREASGVGEDTP